MPEQQRAKQYNLYQNGIQIMARDYEDDDDDGKLKNSDLIHCVTMSNCKSFLDKNNHNSSENESEFTSSSKENKNKPAYDVGARQSWKSHTSFKKCLALFLLDEKEKI